VIRLTIWLPPLAWMAAIMWFSSGDFSAENTGSILGPLVHWLLPWASPSQIAAVHGIVRKGAHMAEYALLAALWFVALRRARRWPPAPAAWAALLISIGWAFLDELHQATEPSRTASVVDVGFDAAGALLASIVARIGWRRATASLTSTLLWLAAAGGAIVIAINLASGVESGALWLTVPVAAALLLWRRRSRRRRATSSRLEARSSLAGTRRPSGGHGEPFRRPP
jgi:VanZ family protein